MQLSNDQMRHIAKEITKRILFQLKDALGKGELVSLLERYGMQDLIPAKKVLH